MDNLNNVVATEETKVNDEMVEIIPDQNSEKKSKLTGGQKAIGLSVIGFAIFGIVQLVRLCIKGVRTLFGKLRSKKAEKADKTGSEEIDVIDVDMTEEEILNQTEDNK